MPACNQCGKPIRKFTVTTDWTERGLHKKCWKQLIEIDTSIQITQWEKVQQEAKDRLLCAQWNLEEGTLT